MEPIRRIYYCFPWTVIMAFGFAYWLSWLFKEIPQSKYVAKLIILLMVMNNFSELFQHKTAIDNGHGWSKMGEQRLIALRNYRNPSFYVPEKVKKDAVYQSFLSYIQSSH
ncbi:MAG: hypothetical protein HY537_04405 [Deltaproteobacteria bacterium]|nr:hypothetical protein [Deltaproteobacteria bacterium]